MLKRFTLNIIFLLSIILMPWWVSVLFGVFLIFHIEGYYEVIVAGFVLDYMYSAPTEIFYNFQFVYTLIFLFFFGISVPLKKVLRGYHK